ncbi:hypothetical protein [Paenibacillus radicis (ex Gao et al. 2016)]|uniref:WD40 repeat domain-containing protein n=1 Tax=Paenibacillus radicis (ex Gao et al. 2016) TaxID=1737354 RepID=A0A917LY32_9BACL|nr:hypothetical protein [Paenibacillus radicis (ex Gao et al. 2016)]GGG65390.1 hypothetical protein GCM10010918_19500 [Paenibacillus radicis (ex Gao et al. 2016)]
MLNKWLKAILILVLIAVITSCASNLDQPERQPVLEATTAPLVTSEERTEPEESMDALLRRNYANAIKLSTDEYDYENMVAVSSEEVLLLAKSHDSKSTRLICMNIQSRVSTVAWESGSESIDTYSLRLAEDHVEWETYDAEQSVNRKYKLASGVLVSQIGTSYASPDGQWAVSYSVDNKNIEGIIKTSTGISKQWRTEGKDSQPLWLPDSSGFVYLHDTGEQIGDGAGPYYELARYDIASGKSSILPFDKAYWGRIEWLEPGVSLVAHNGFDDVIALKIVNLESGEERQIVNTYEYEYLNSFVEPVTGRLFVSNEGKFSLYGSEGQATSEVAWPVNLDEYSLLKKETSDSSTERIHYYIGEKGSGRFGPSQFQPSPDGNRIAYLLGAIGESVDDIVTGTRVAVADYDGSGTKLLTEDYMYIGLCRWAPDSSRLFALFSLPSDRQQVYIGVIDL